MQRFPKSTSNPGAEMTAHRLLIATIIAFIAGEVKAQQFVLPVNEISRMRMERAGVQMQEGVHFGSFPVIKSTADVSMVPGLGPDTALYYYKITSKIFSEHLVEFEKPGLQIEIDPLFDFMIGRQNVNDYKTDETPSRLFSNTRGFAISAKVGDAVYVYTDFRENQSSFPGYVTNFVDSLDVTPGNGRTKPFGDFAYDYSMASGFVGFSPTKWLHLQAGHYKQFIGHGRRSLLLSDNAFNYPFLKYTLRLWEGKVQYQYSLALLQNLIRLPLGDAPESLFQRKYASWHYVSYKPVPSFEIGFFESVMWKYYDTTTGTQPFNFNAINPVIFVNTLILGLDDANNNAMVGVNAAWQKWKSLRVYGQYSRTGKQSNGYQLGMKYYNILNRLDFGLEYNQVDPFSYASESALQGFTHTNQPLAHPLGAGFEEIISSLTYNHKRMYAKGSLMMAKLDSEGRNPLIPISSEQQTTAKSDVLFYDIQVAYIFNPTTNMQVYAGFSGREENKGDSHFQNEFWYIGMRTCLQNIYRDF